MIRLIQFVALISIAASASWAQQFQDGGNRNGERRGQNEGRQGGPRVGEINEGETRKLKKRIEALRLTSLGIGPFGSSQVESNPLNYGFSYYKHFEAGVNGEILLGATAAFSGTSSFLFGGVGGNYLFSPEDVSPVAGAEFGLGAAHYTKDSATTINESGFAAKFNGGVRFFRTSDAQMEILASYTTLFSSSHPGFYGVEVRVLF